MIQLFMDEKTTGTAVGQYKQEPWSFTPEDVDVLGQHAVAHNIPFAPVQEQHDFSMRRALSAMTHEYFSGIAGPLYSPENVAQNDFEGIFGAVGHFAGFAGITPIGFVGRLLQGSGKLSGSAKLFVDTMSKAKGLSVPMKGADLAMKIASTPSNVLLAHGLKSEIDLIKKTSKMVNSDLGRSIIHGSVHLGAASAISDLNHGIDNIMMSAFFGAIYGGGFKVLGHAIRIKGDPLAERFARGLAGSVFQGLPATIRGESTPQQVYEYLLGAYFGQGSKPAHHEAGMKAVVKWGSAPLAEGATKKENFIHSEAYKDLSPEAKRFAADFYEQNLKIDMSTLALRFLQQEDPENFDKAKWESELGSVYETYGQVVAEKQRLDRVYEDLLDQTNSQAGIGEASNREKSYEFREVEELLLRQDPGEEVVTLVSKPTVKRVIENNSLTALDPVEAHDTIARIDTKVRHLVDQAKEGKRFNVPEEVVKAFADEKVSVNLEDPDIVRIAQGIIRVSTAIERDVVYWDQRVDVKTEEDFKGVSDFGVPVNLGKQGRLPSGDQVFGRGQPTIFEEVVGRLYGTEEQGMHIFEHVVSKDMGLVSLSRIKAYQPVEYAQIASNMDFHMATKGFFYLSGRGDTARRYYVKRHPLIPENATKTYLDTVYGAFEKVILKASKEDPRLRLMNFQQAVASGMLGKLPRDVIEGLEKKGELNTILYTLEANGFNIKTLDDAILHLPKLFEKGYISGAKNVNKRMQIWLTSGNIIPEIPGAEQFMDQRGGFPVLLLEDAQGNIKTETVASGASRYEQATDGGTIFKGELIKLMERAIGIQYGGLKSKFFSISPDSLLGALLTKHMAAAGGKDHEAMLDRFKVAGMIRMSGAKQIGGRKTYRVNENGDLVDSATGLVTENPMTYVIKPSEIRYVMSEKTDGHALVPQSLPKSVMVMFSETAWNPMSNIVLKEMHQDFVVRNQMGTPEGASLLKSYMNANTAITRKLALKELAANIDEVSVHELNKLINTGDPEISWDIITAIVRKDGEILEMAAREGEIDNANIQRAAEAHQEYESTVERVIRTGASKESMLGNKVLRSYMNKSIRNYFVNRVLRPKVKNSASLRLVGYDEWIRKGGKHLERMEHDDSIFYLENGVKQLRVTTEIPGYEKTTLGKLWQAYNRGVLNTYKEEVQEIFRAAVIRVPQDSISGLQVLNFAGFTDTNTGLGIIVHPRAMEAIGGADLDGDKAFAFFGGEKHGFKKAWKDEFAKNKFEFHEKVGDARAGSATESWTGKHQKKFLGLDLEYVDKIEKRNAAGRTEPGAWVNFDTGKAKVNLRRLKEIYDRRVERSGDDPTRREGMRWGDFKTFFTSFEDFVTFVLRHEMAHISQRKQGIHESVSAYESRINDYAAKEMDEIYKQRKGDGKRYSIRDGKMVEDPNGEYTGKITDNQADVASGIVKNDPLTEEMSTASSLMFSPHRRSELSMAAATGRDGLGQHVNFKNLATAMYTRLKADKEREFEVGVYDEQGDQVLDRFNNPVKRRVSASAIEGVDVIAEFSLLTRKAIGSSTDPMNYAGLTLPHEVKNMIMNKIIKFDGKLSAKQRKEVYAQLLAPYVEVNSALWGKKKDTGLRYTNEEIDVALANLPGANAKDKVSYFEYLAQSMRGFYFDDNPLNRLQDWQVINLYKAYNKRVDNDAYREVGKLLGRGEDGSVKVKLPDEVRLFYKYGLGERSRELHTNGLMQEKDSVVADLMDKFWGVRPSHREFAKSERGRLRLQRFIETRSKDYYFNDMWDMASTAVFSYGKLGIGDPARFRELSVLSAMLKGASVLARNRKNKGKEVESMFKFEGRWYNVKTLDQIDETITRIKKHLSPSDRRRFDLLILGSMNKISKEEVAKMIKERKKFLHLTQPEDAEEFFRHASRFSQLGMSSKAVSDASLKHFMKVFSFVTDAAFYDKFYGKPAYQGRITEEFNRVFGGDPKTASDLINGRVVMEGGLIKEKFRTATIERDLVEMDIGIEQLRSRMDELALRSDVNGKELQELTGWQKDMYVKLKDHLEHYHISLGNDINLFARGMFGKDLRVFNKEDYMAMDNWFRVTREGTFFQRNFAEVLTTYPLLRKAHWWMFPEAIARDVMRFYTGLEKREGAYIGPDGNMKRGPIALPIVEMSQLQKDIGLAQTFAEKFADNQISRVKAELIPFLEGEQTAADSGNLFKIAAHMINNKYTAHLRDIIAMGDDESVTSREKLTERIKVNEEGWEFAQRETDWINLSKKEYAVTVGEGQTIKMTGRDVVEKVMGIVENSLLESRRTIDGIGPEKYDKNIIELIRQSYRKDGKLLYAYGLDNMVNFNRGHLFQIALKAWGQDEKKADASLKRALSGLRSVSHKTGDLPGFFPRTYSDKSLIFENKEKRLEKILSNKSLSPEERVKEAVWVEMNFLHRTGRYDISDSILMDNMLTDEFVRKARKDDTQVLEKMKFTESVGITGHMMARGDEVPGWDPTPEALYSYIKGVHKDIHKLAANMLVNETIHTFREKTSKQLEMPDDLRDAWVGFYRLYSQDAMGNPSVIPQVYIDGKSGVSKAMNLRGTAYHWFADSTVRSFLDRAFRKMGIREPKYIHPGEAVPGFDKNNPEGKVGVYNKGKFIQAETREETARKRRNQNLKHIDLNMKRLSYNDLSRWGQLEAQYQLATLLFHPKSAVANIFGGAINTAISAGPGMLKNATNIAYLRNNINPQWRSMEDVSRWVTSLGIIDEHLVENLQSNPIFRKGKYKVAADELMSLGSRLREPEKVMNILRKHGITDSMMDKFGFFMRKPEQMLRRDAFVAHYLQARKMFGNTLPWDHPLLIEIAKKGVSATQFMYSSTYRPAFARTALGKVMSRFQMWAWSSVKFRNGIIRDAKVYGIRTGSMEMARFKRMAAIDIFVMAAMQAFAFSIFEMSLPSPYSYMQDIGEWIFGDEETRKRAFFGAYPTPIAPLQLITPPSLRLLGPAINALYTGDLNKIAAYHIWTLFPGGRIAKDVKKTIENPIRTMDIWTGVPMTKFPKVVKVPENQFHSFY